MTWVNVHGVQLEVMRLSPQRPAQADALAKKTTLVFLHEGLGSIALWHSRTPWWTQQLCDRLGLPGLVYSRQGYGQSDPIVDVRGSGRHGPDYMHHHAWDTLPALLASLGIRRPILVGHSDGGTIALLHAARFEVAACVVMAPHVMVEPISLNAIAQAQQAFEHGDLATRLQRFHADVNSAFWQWCDVWRSSSFADMDIRPWCKRIKAPLLAIQGRDDAYGTLAQIHDICPSGPITRVVLDHCGHSPHRDCPTATLSHIEVFLNTTSVDPIDQAPVLGTP